MVDLILNGGRVWTGAPQAGEPEPTALAVREGRVVAVGTDDEIEVLAGPGVERVALEGRRVLPGLIDAHTHFITGGFHLAAVQLRDAADRDTFVRRIRDHVQGVAPGSWVTGGAWDHELWGGELPTRQWIDEATPNHPVLVTRLDLHMALANSKALELAGIDDHTPDPPGGAIVRDGDGRATGILKDEAMVLARRVMPPRSPEEWDAALARACRHALSLGLTQVHDVDGWESLEAHRRAHGVQALPLRIYTAVPMESWERLAAMVRTDGRGDQRLWWGGLKAFVDGSLGSGTAWFHEPYSDEPGNHGLRMSQAEGIPDWVRGSDAAGLHSIVHAIGDRAVDWLLDVYEEVARQNGPRDRRARVEHAQHLSPGAARRFAELNVVASMQPYHAADDGRWAERRIGSERRRRAFPCRSLLDAGTTLAFGSDWTVAPLDPLLGIRAAVTRELVDGSRPGGWVPEERIGLGAALTAYTRSAAYAGFSNDFTGTLEAGKLADLVVLSDDPFRVSVETLDRIEVEMTFVEGREVYRRGEGA